MEKYPLELDYYHLLSLHKALLEAKFHTQPDNNIIAGSPLVADVYAQVRDLLISSEKGSQWEAWFQLKNSAYRRKQAITLIKRQEKHWENRSWEDKKRIVSNYLAPYLFGEEELIEVIAELDGKRLILETLFAYAYLWLCGLGGEEAYDTHLDLLFSQTPEDRLLLALECCSSNPEETISLLQHHFDYDTDIFDQNAFGQALVAGLETTFRSGVCSIAEFCRRCYALWRMLPGFLTEEEPFFHLSYVDDPLSWGDENQARELCEEIFGFYRKASSCSF